MKQLFPRGKRIRPTDKDLVFHTALAALFPVFLLVVLLFHIRQIAGTNWQEVSLSQEWCVLSQFFCSGDTAGMK